MFDHIPVNMLPVAFMLIGATIALATYALIAFFKYDNEVACEVFLYATAAAFSVFAIGFGGYFGILVMIVAIVIAAYPNIQGFKKMLAT